MSYLRIFFLILIITALLFPALGLSAVHEKSVGSDNVRLEWGDSMPNVSCPSVNGTVFSFMGKEGNSYTDDDKSALNDLENNLSSGCVRLIRVTINPDVKGGYWLNRSSYFKAAMLMNELTYKAENRWKDTDGNKFADGKIIVAGISAGAAIAARALEDTLVSVGPRYPLNFDRTILLSGPLGADVSVECGIIVDTGLKEALDKYFETGDACLNGEEVDAGKDVVMSTGEFLRSYLSSGNEIAIFVGKEDYTGCQDEDDSQCEQWDAVEAVERYIQIISGGNDSVFTRVSESSANQDNFYANMLYEVDGDYQGHSLWKSDYVLEQVCKHAFVEVNELLGTADKLSLDDCEITR
jgi:hypothetical protein